MRGCGRGGRTSASFGCVDEEREREIEREREREREGSQMPIVAQGNQVLPF